jgi:TRAP-type mannitol/chloroaromatic compound transport system substrate-binding protein
MKTSISRFHTTATALYISMLAMMPGAANALDIQFRSFSGSAAIGPPAEAYATKLNQITTTALGAGANVKFIKLPGIPAIPTQFRGDIVAAVGAGGALAGGTGFDAAYISGGDLNRAWGFLFNSGVPFGPTFDEYLGFLYGKSIGGQQTGLELLQSILDRNNRNVVVVPIVGSSEQGSGYFPLPVGNVPGMHGIGLAGLCQQYWTFRYLPPAEFVLGRACDNLVASGAIPAKNIQFIAAVPGGGSLVQAVINGTLHAFEFATPLDDVSQLFNTANNPGTVGLKYLHFPGWHQQFLITHMLVNKQVWNSMSAAQQTLARSVARDNLVSSYGENMRQQGTALQFILDANNLNPSQDMVLVDWPKKDQEQLRDATIQFLNARSSDPMLPAADQQDYTTVLEALRTYVRSNNLYWNVREVNTKMRFDDWQNAAGESWAEKQKSK